MDDSTVGSFGNDTASHLNYRGLSEQSYFILTVVFRRVFGVWKPSILWGLRCAYSLDNWTNMLQTHGK